MRWRRVAHRLPLTGVAVAGAVVGHMVAYVLARGHEETTVGKYHFVVGFGDEPAYAGEPTAARCCPSMRRPGPTRAPHPGERHGRQGLRRRLLP